MRFYLYRSVQNQCLNYIRDKRVEENYRNETEVASEDFFYNVLLEEEVFIRLRGAINELPEKYRDVINLNLEGLSDKEIALIWEYLWMPLNNRKRGEKNSCGKS